MITYTNILNMIYEAVPAQDIPTSTEDYNYLLYFVYFLQFVALLASLVCIIASLLCAMWDSSQMLYASLFFFNAVGCLLDLFYVDEVTDDESFYSSNYFYLGKHSLSLLILVELVRREYIKQMQDEVNPIGG